MSDLVTVTEGEYTADVLVDLTSSGVAQVVKLAYSADGDDTLIEAGANGLLVNLGAGGNTIGKLASNSGVDIGDVDVNSVSGDVTVVQTDPTELQAQVQITNGSDIADVISLANHDALSVAIVNGSGDQITSFGGGTQYTEADVDATITGTAVMWEDTSDTLRVASAAKPLPVNVVSGAAAGTQYTEADTDASITGTAVMWEDSGDTLRAVSAAKPLPVGDAGGSLTVDNGGTFAVQESGSALTALQLIDDGVYTDDTSTHATGTSKGYLMMAAATPTDISVNANDIGAVAMTTDRKLQVSVPDAVTVNSHAVTNAGTFAVQVDGSALTALQLIDDPVATLGTTTYTEAATKGMIMGAVRRDANTTLVDTTNEVAPLQVDANGNLKVNIIAGAGSGGTASVDDAAFTAAVGSGTPMMGFATSDTVDSGDVGVVAMTTARELKVSVTQPLVAGTNNIGDVDVLTLPAKKITYAASSALTQTNLDGLASSSTHVAGWESNAIDNSSNLYLDYIINADIQVESAGISAGEIRMYLVAELNDSAWPDVFDGTESAETVSDTNIRDAICRLAAITLTDTTASQHYYLNCPSVAAVFGGTVPRKFVVFITQSTGANLESTGDPNQVYVKGVYLT